MMNDRLLLLGLLRREEMHGYQLHEFIDRELAFCTDLKKPTAYYLLNKMTAEGWISEETAQEGNRPPRKVYSITPAGEAAFQRLLRQNVASYIPSHFPGDVGIAYLDALPPGEALSLLRQRRAQLQLAQDQTGAAPAHRGSLEWVVEHQRRHLAAEAEWLEEIIARLEQGLK